MEVVLLLVIKGLNFVMGWSECKRLLESCFEFVERNASIVVRRKVMVRNAGFVDRKGGCSVLLKTIFNFKETS